MKKLISSLSIAIAIIIFSPSNPTTRADIIYPDGSVPTGYNAASSAPKELRKFARGLANILTCGLEIPKAWLDTSRDQGITNMGPWFEGALVLGPYKAMERLRAGFYDLATVFENDKTLTHSSPDFLSLGDILPGYNNHFTWDSLSTSAGTPPLR